MKYSIIFTILLLLFSACKVRQSGRNIERVTIKTGAEKLIEDDFSLLRGKNVGFITNHTAVVGDKHLADIMHESPDVNLVTLFGPEHGFRGDSGGYVESEFDVSTGLPVYSLYGEHQKPTAEMLEGLDVLVFDIQDIGPRFYTYISTLGKAMEAAAEHDISLIVLDRPNPLGGELSEGFVLEPEYKSFVGYFPIPVTHGLTLGELALMVKGERMLKGIDNLDLNVVEMENWGRSLLWPDINLEWNRPSPNIPDFETALIYPGACFFGGTSGSQGRGTMEPFIVVGGLWADGELIASDLNSRNLPGLKFEGVTFTPESILYRGMATNPWLKGMELQGVRHIITDFRSVRPVETGIHLLHAFYKHATPDQQKNFFRDPPFNRLAGTNRLYDMLAEGSSAEEIIASWRDELHEFDIMRRRYFLYK